ncbi:MAG: hypothetical protein Kapaf2KO_19140 [Candidatus Kapaibacteriales bacterium]
MKKLIIITVLSLAVAMLFGFACGSSNDSSPISSSAADGGNGNGGNSSVGGSLARFTIVGNFLYSVDMQNLQVINISDPRSPQFIAERNVGNDIETVFASGGFLYIGSQTGMIIYDISDPANPQLMSRYEHVESCDPVVTKGDFAYVTLRSGNFCWRGENRLEVLDISDKRNVRLLEEINMENPRGLGIYGDYLYVCDAGWLKIFDISDQANPSEIDGFSADVFDVIPLPYALVAVGEGTLSQYNYVEAGKSLEKISAIRIN